MGEKGRGVAIGQWLVLLFSSCSAVRGPSGSTLSVVLGPLARCRLVYATKMEKHNTENVSMWI